MKDLVELRSHCFSKRKEGKTDNMEITSNGE